MDELPRKWSVRVIKVWSEVYNIQIVDEFGRHRMPESAQYVVTEDTTLNDLIAIVVRNVQKY